MTPEKVDEVISMLELARDEGGGGYTRWERIPWRHSGCSGDHARRFGYPAGVVSNVWRTRRVLVEQLVELASELRSEEPIAPPVLKEQTMRLLAGMVMLLQQHEVNEHGQCRVCSVPGNWLFWRRKSQCTVYRYLGFAMRQPLDFVRDWTDIAEIRQLGQKWIQTKTGG